MADPELLVVLPTLGERLDFLEHALESTSALSLLVPTTVVVVLPSSATAARAVCGRFGVTLVDDPGTGMAEAINRGLAVATTEKYYVWVGDDDRLIAPGVAALVRALWRNDSAVVAYGHCDYITSDGTVVARSRAGWWANFLLPWGPNLIPHPGTVIRLRALRARGGFNPQLRYALDLDVFLSLRGRGAFVALPVVSAEFRWHSESLTVADRRASSREAMMVKRAHLPVVLRALSPLWEWPVAWASALAAHLVTTRARRVSP